MSYWADKLVIDTHTHRPTDAGDDNTRWPKLASGKKQWNLNQNTIIFIQENVFENDVGKMAAILFPPRYVNKE